MGLQSEFFRGDQKLEAAAVSDPDHILPGSRGPHVRKIQTALVLVDGAVIGPGEIGSSFFGQSTARAVLAYKKQRKIINQSYQAQADNIVGKMTMASLDSDMLGRKVILSRRGCDYGPRFSSGLRLSFAFSVGGPESVQVTGGSPAATPLEMALNARTAAIGLNREARDVLGAAIKNDGTEAARLGSQALTRHYKVSSPQDIVSTAKKVSEFLSQGLGRLVSARAWLRSGVGDGFAETPEPRDGHTYILPGYALAGNLMRPLVLIHEAFHDLDGFNQDFGGNPARDQGARYHQNTTSTQLRNAYAVSQLVLHIHEKREKFLEDGE